MKNGLQNEKSESKVGNEIIYVSQMYGMYNWVGIRFKKPEKKWGKLRKSWNFSLKEDKMDFFDKINLRAYALRNFCVLSFYIFNGLIRKKIHQSSLSVFQKCVGSCSPWRGERPAESCTGLGEPSHRDTAACQCWVGREGGDWY